MLYAIVKFIFSWFFFFLGLKSEGIHKLPEKGPVILAANHLSNWDPIVVAVAAKRPIHYMGKAQLFENIMLAWLMKRLNVFPVKRGVVDKTAIKSALTVLEEHEVLGIFPEGMRNQTGEELKAQSGVALLALKSGAPVVPVACIGTDRNLPLGWLRPLVVRIGNPLNMEEYKGQKVNSSTLERLSTQIMQEINLLLLK